MTNKTAAKRFSTLPPETLKKLSPIVLETQQPQQARAQKTYHRILSETAKLLESQGLESISTNIIAAQVGISVPALYRYFPNKYAIIYTLAARLSDDQNQILVDWYSQYIAPLGSQALDLRHLDKLLSATLKVNQQHTAALSIIRTMRALPQLQALRLQSHSNMANLLLEALAQQYSKTVTPTLSAQFRLLLEVANSALDMALEDDELPNKLLLQETQQLITPYLHHLCQQMGVPYIAENKTDNTPSQ